LALMTELFEKEALRAPSLKVVGDLSAETVRKAHHLLEGGKVKGKLAMRVSD